MRIKRDNILTLIRDISMILIVFYHSMCYTVGIWGLNPQPQSSYGAVAGFIANLGLTFFVLISGFLYETISSQSKDYNSNKLFVIKKVKRLLVPYIIWGGIMVSCLGYSWKELFGGIMHLWFLIMLFIVSVLFHLTRKIWGGKTIFKQFIILILLFVCQMGIYPLESFVTNSTVLKLFKNVTDWLPVYYMGILLVENKVFQKLTNKNFIWVRTLFLSVLLYVIFITLNVKSEYLSLPHCVLFISIYIFLTNTKIQVLWDRVKISSLFDKLAKYSLGIYIIHHLLIYDTLKNIAVCRNLVNVYYSIAPILIFLIVLPLSYLFVALISRSRFSEYIIGVK